MKAHEELVTALVKPGDEISGNMDYRSAHIIHMCLGLAGEVGELIDAIKKATIYGKPMDRENVIEELGDIEFYLEGLRQGLFISREVTMLKNIEKLTRRYPQGRYTDADAKARADKVEGE